MVSNFGSIFKRFLLILFIEFQSVNGGGNYDYGEAPTVCQPPPFWTENGRDVMYDYLGNVTLVALMELQCSFCRNQLSSLERLSDYSKNHSLPVTKVIIIAPHNESTAFVDYYREILKDKNIIVIQESQSEPIWSKLRGSDNDFFIYDTCGRLNYHVPYPQSFTYYHYTINTIYSVHKHNKCGPCSGYPPQRRQPQPGSQPLDPNSYTPQRIKAYVITIPPGYHPDDYYATRHPEQAPYPYDETATSQPGAGFSEAATEIPATPASVDQITSTRSAHKIRHDKHNRNKNRKKNRTRATTRAPLTATVPTTTTTIATTTTTPTPTTPPPTTTTDFPITPVDENNFDEPEYGNSEEEDLEGNENQSGSPTTKTHEIFDTATAQVPSPTADVTEPVSPISDVIYEEDDESEFEKSAHGNSESDATGGDSSVTASVTTVTSKQSTTTTRKSRPRVVNKPIKIHKTPNGSVECSAFSELACFDLQEHTRQEDPCCYKGVYLTNICSTNKCNSDTYHICCFQKFQQARYQCCHDPMPFDRPDDFSKCCYTHFAEQDPCCPALTAHKYWSHRTRVTELCLPNIEVSYAGIVLDATFEDKTNISIDLGKFNSLNYQCPAAMKRSDFFYWEPESAPRTEAVEEQQEEHGAE